MTTALMITMGFFSLFVITLLIKGIRIVPEQSAVMIERLGKFRTQLNPGLNIIVPVIDKHRGILWRSTIRDGEQRFHSISEIANIDLREQVYDFPSQSVITSDNVGIRVDAVVYFQVIDAKRTVYEISNLPNALETLTQTTLRNIIGEMELDQTLTSRDTINAKLVETIDAAAGAWGIKINRVEVQDITPPQDVQASMEQQMKAERERRARVTEADGIREAQVMKAQGERDARIAMADGEREAAIREAQGHAEAVERLADAEKYRVQIVAEALGAEAPEFLIGMRYMETLDRMAANENTVWMPHSATDLASFIGGYKHLLQSEGKVSDTP